MRCTLLIFVLFINKYACSQITFEIQNMCIYEMQNDSLDFDSEDSMGPCVEFECLFENTSDTTIKLDLTKIRFNISYLYNREVYNCWIGLYNIFLNDTLCDFLNDRLILLPPKEKVSGIKFQAYFFFENPWLDKRYLRTLLKILPTMEIYLIDGKKRFQAKRILHVDIRT